MITAWGLPSASRSTVALAETSASLPRNTSRAADSGVPRFHSLTRCRDSRTPSACQGPSRARCTACWRRTTRRPACFRATKPPATKLFVEASNSRRLFGILAAVGEALNRQRWLAGGRHCAPSHTQSAFSVTASASTSSNVVQAGSAFRNDGSDVCRQMPRTCVLSCQEVAGELIAMSECHLRDAVGRGQDCQRVRLERRVPRILLQHVQRSRVLLSHPIEGTGAVRILHVEVGVGGRRNRGHAGRGGGASGIAAWQAASISNGAASKKCTRWHTWESESLDMIEVPLLQAGRAVCRRCDGAHV